MKKELVVLAAGAVMLTGCTQYVMQDRYYEDLPGSAPQAGTRTMAPEQRADALPEPEPAPEVKEVTPAEKPQPQTKLPHFEPMENVVSTPVNMDKLSADKTAGNSAAAADGSTYMVQKGDTLGKIAYKHHVKLADLMAANSLTEADAARLRIGRKLVIPGKGAVKSAAAPAVKPAAKPVESVAAAPALAEDGTYTIKSGDTPEKIARRFKVKLADLLQANQLSEADARRLQIGRKLVIPGRKAAVSAAETPVTPAPAADAVPATVAAETPAPAADAVPTETPAVELPDAADAAPAEVIKTPKFRLIEDDEITVGALASRYGVTVEDIGKVNNKPDMSADEVLHKGEYIFIPEK